MKSFRVLLHRRGLLHVETPLGIVNISVGLHDRKDREVESVEVLPSNAAGEKKVIRRGYANTRLIRLKGVRQR